MVCVTGVVIQLQEVCRPHTLPTLHGVFWEGDTFLAGIGRAGEKKSVKMQLLTEMQLET